VWQLVDFFHTKRDESHITNNRRDYFSFDYTHTYLSAQIVHSASKGSRSTIAAKSTQLHTMPRRERVLMSVAFRRAPLNLSTKLWNLRRWQHGVCTLLCILRTQAARLAAKWPSRVEAPNKPRRGTSWGHFSLFNSLRNNMLIMLSARSI